jgi:hypothetical protein
MDKYASWGRLSCCRTLAHAVRKGSLSAPQWTNNRAPTRLIWTAVERGFSAVVAEHIGLICGGTLMPSEVAAGRCMDWAPVCA